MNPEGGKIWKKLAKKDLVMGPRVTGMTLSPESKKVVNDLKDKLDDTYTLSDINVLVNPNTFEPVIKFVLMKTEKK